DDLLEAGCRDLRLTELMNSVDPFLDAMADLMTRQTKAPPVILSRQDLASLGVSLEDALHCLGALRIPDTLGHSDFNPGNILIGSDQCRFIDWAEAYIGHPFLTFEYFMSHLRKSYPALVPFEDNLRAGYARPWRAASSPED